jgi:hypothetical protein
MTAYAKWTLILAGVGLCLATVALAWLFGVPNIHWLLWLAGGVGVALGFTMILAGIKWAENWPARLVALALGGLFVVGLGSSLLPYVRPVSDRAFAGQIQALIDENDDFAPGEFAHDVSAKACPWITREALEALVRAPGHFSARIVEDQTMLSYTVKPIVTPAHILLLRSVSGLAVSFGTDCSAWVRRGDAI